MSLKVRHKSDNAKPTLSGFWATCPQEVLNGDPTQGYFFYDDFLNFGDHITDQDTQQYATYIDTGVTIKGLATERTGMLQIAGNDADNDAGVIRTGGTTGVCAEISDAAGENQKLWFECRIKTASIADNGCSLFVGLAAEVSLAATDTVQTTDTGVLKLDHVGFQVLAADGDSLDTMYATAGTVVQHKDGAQTLVADTFYKLGIYYDGTGVYYYIDGVQVTPDTAGGADDGIGVLPAATSFPDAEELGLMLATKVGTAAEVKVTMDWWALAQLRAET